MWADMSVAGGQLFVQRLQFRLQSLLKGLGGEGRKEGKTEGYQREGREKRGKEAANTNGFAAREVISLARRNGHDSV
jgi:hypothetical protein